MFDLKGFRKDRKLSQKQISEILGIGTSFISQIETGKDPMPGYVTQKLSDAFGKEEVEKYYRESPQSIAYTERRLRKKHLFPSGGYYSARKPADTAAEATGSTDATDAAGSPDAEWVERVLRAIERRDELALMQQREYERQGERIDTLLAFLKN